MKTDLRYAIRQLLKNPGFTLIAVLTLALGIGANTAIFTVVNGVLLRPLPYPAPAQMVTLQSQQSVPELGDIREQSQSFTAVGGVGTQAADYTGGAEPVQLEIGLVAGDFFSVLGTRMQMGRAFNSEEDRFDGPRVLVLTHGLWQRQFGGDPNIIGREIILAGQNYNVVGVTAPDFRPPNPTMEAFVPIHVFYPAAAKARGAHLLRVYARLRPGVSRSSAQSELNVIDQRLALANPDENRDRQSVLVSLQEKMVGDIRPALLVLFGAVGLVLLIACANFANLLLVRMARRTMELAVWAALGASRVRLIGQVLMESSLLALLGGGAGLVLGTWGIEALLALKPADLPLLENIHLDARVLAFTFGLTLLTGLFFGIFPAWQTTRVKESGALAGGGHSVTARSPLRSLLVVVELALALVLLIGAGLLGKTFWRLTSVAPGFNPARVLAMRVELPEARYKEVAPQTQFRERVLENLNTLPGVEVAMISELPLGGNAIDHNFLIEGRAPIPAGKEPELYSRSIAGDYFKIMSIPLLGGRVINLADRAGAPLVGVINEAMEKKYFGAGDPIGARIRWAREEGISWITIVGVVGDVRHFGLAEAEEPAIYTPYAQSGQSWKRWSEIVLRAPANLDRQTLTAQAKSMIWKVDPLVAVPKVRAMAEVMSGSLAQRKFNTILLGAFAGIALLLATVGLYGVLAFSVAQRTREIGIRVAVGAQRRDVIKLVLGQGVVLALLGVGAGVIASLAGTRLLASLLYGLKPTDPVTFVALAVFLIVVALVACLIPARRAARVDPMIALHYE